MAQSLREATRGRLRSMVDSLYSSCLQVRRPSHGPHVSRKRVAVIRSFEYSGLIQSREVGVPGWPDGLSGSLAWVLRVLPATQKYCVFPLFFASACAPLRIEPSRRKM